MKVWVVTEGEYSDFHIEGIFTTEEKAQEYVNLYQSLSYGGYNIEEWDTDPEFMKAAPGYTYWNVTLDYYTGEAKSIWKAGLIDIGFTEWSRIEESKETKYRKAEKWFCTIAEATDEEHATKIAAERRAEWIELHDMSDWAEDGYIY